MDRAGSRVAAADETVPFEDTGAGRLIAVVRSGPQPGRVTVRATAPGLRSAEVALTVQR